MITIRNQQWRDSAKCRGMDVNDFDLSSARYNHVDRQDLARQLCSGCPVVVQCAADAIVTTSRGFVRGGVWLPMRGEKIGKQRLRAVVRGG